MAIVQDVYNAVPAKGYPGMVANGETSNRISRTCEDAAGIPFGSPVFQGAGDEGCAAAGTAFLGFAIADHGIAVLPGGPAADVYPRYSSVGIMTYGTIYVTAPGAVAKEAAVPGADGWVYDETLSAAGIVRIAKRK